ncbi:hypothetical protein J6TS2_33380 [Heyndrickxia sporothermodurans]|nr:hypothetical protein J6TS2_33380 [Heyndrickxia sporothermodurans]
MQNIKINNKPPNISEETMREMAAFFLKTSIPRIIAKEKKKVEKLE